MSKECETVVTAIAEALGEEPGAGPGIACLVVLYGRNLGKRYYLDQSELIIGRSDAVAIEVDQESVSRQHVKLVTEDGRTAVVDLGSTNGTFVNNQRVTERELRDGDQLRVGRTIFKYLSSSNIEAKYHEEIYRLTTTDGLTQAYNKRYFLETLSREINRAVRYARTLGLVMLDIDHFKGINDVHGHLAGDCVLRDMAAIVFRNIRREDVLARYGGEEFAIILPEIDPSAAVVVCEKLRSCVVEAVFDYGGKRIPVTISLGLRVYSGGEEDSEIEPTKLIADADERLYLAKQSGRNRVVFW